MKKELIFSAMLMVAAASAGSLMAQEYTAGPVEYAKACASCHGANGEGDGPLVAELVSTPPDLTLLAQKNDGVFPFAEVFKIIDGRNNVRAHGSEMQVWGTRFKADAAEAGEYGSEINALGRMTALVYHLQAIQK